MTLRLYHFRGNRTNGIYHAIGHSRAEAERKLGILRQSIILERSEPWPPLSAYDGQEPFISSNTAQYHSPRK